jgi:histidinol-phosphatase
VSFRAPFEGDLQADLTLALRLGGCCGRGIHGPLRRRRPRRAAQGRRDHVTEADLATERAIREILEAERPDDGVFGEEFGVTGSTERSGSSTRSTAPRTTSRASRCGRA